MSLIDDYNLEDYETVEDVQELLRCIEDEMSTLRGYKRGAEEKLSQLEKSGNPKD